MKIKKLFGICERKGCTKIAKRSILIKNCNYGEKQIQLCEECAWELYQSGLEILREKK